MGNTIEFWNDFRFNGNVKNQMLPFQLKNDGSQFSNKLYSGGNENFSYYVFSFRPKDTKSCEDGTINIIPDDRNQFSKDIGLSQIVSKMSDEKGKDGTLQ